MDESRIACAGCGRSFAWDDAFWTRQTPGSHPHNPTAYGDNRPRAYCPACGALIAEWHLTRERDHRAWAWFDRNDVVNAGKPLPPSPTGAWGSEILDPALIPSYDDHVLDVARVRELATGRD